MDKLSAELKLKIEANPTQTILMGDQRERLKHYYVSERDWIKVPESFDGRKVWDGLLEQIMDQGTCSSCWSFGTTSSLANRFNIQSMGLMKITLSPTRLILCYFDEKSFDVEADPESSATALLDIESQNLSSNACFGNTLYNAWRYLYVVGTNTLECMPYNKKLGYNSEFKQIGIFGDVTELPLCDNISGPDGDMCSNFSYDSITGEELGTPARFYRALHFYYIPGIDKDGGSELNIRHNIYAWGPVSSAMKVFPDFYTFDSANEIYEWNGEGPQVGGHAVEMLGWGVDDKSGKKYWIIANSWGDKWGMKGYFKMVRGVNNCSIEENVIAGVPDFFYPTSDELRSPILKGSESKISQNQRLEIENKIDMVAGGIDPETGYTRRTMATQPWLDWSRPVQLEDLPDFKKFVAGIDATAENRAIFQARVRQKYKDIKYGKQSTYVTVFVLVLMIVFMVGIVIYFFVNKIK